MTIHRMDHLGAVVDDLEAAISFFVELGMELDDGTAPVEGDWGTASSDSMTFESRAHSCGPRGYGRLELTKFHHPTATTARRRAPLNRAPLAARHAPEVLLHG